MLSVTRHRVPVEASDTFADQAAAAVDLLRARPGFVRAAAGRSTDDPTLWVMVSEWVDVGSYRRALSSPEVKVGAVPLLATALDEPTGYETLLRTSADAVVRRGSDRAADADVAGPAGHRGDIDGQG